MCECVCGEAAIKEALAVGENVLGVEIYPGCGDCMTGVQVELHMMTRAQAGELGVEPSREFGPGANGWERVGYPLLGGEDLAEAARELEAGGLDVGAYGSLAELLEEHGLELLQRALRIRRREEEARAAAPPPESAGDEGG